jgi:hypothetical protein
MKKTFLPILICQILFLSCKKSSPAIPPFFALNYAAPTAASGVNSDKDSTLCECIYHPNSPSDGYLFIFRDSTVANNCRFQFVITGDSAGKLAFNQNLTYRYTLSNFYNLSLECLLFVNNNSTVSVTGIDSAEVTANISRNSNGTLSGTLTGIIWQSSTDSAIIKDCIFNYVPVINQ